MFGRVDGEDTVLNRITATEIQVAAQEWEHRDVLGKAMRDFGESVKSSLINIVYRNLRGERPIGEMIMSVGGSVVGQTAAEVCIPGQRSLTERLKEQLGRHREKVSDLEDVIEKLERQPETQELIDAISKLGHF